MKQFPSNNYFTNFQSLTVPDSNLFQVRDELRAFSHAEVPRFLCVSSPLL